MTEKVAFIATCQGLDQEMKKRIAKHKKSRPGFWENHEAPADPEKALPQISKKCELVIIDCVTLLLSNLLLQGKKENIIVSKIKKIIRILKSARCDAILVSNEVGLGIVPENSLARNFRDLAGRVNQLVAKKSDEVIFMSAGLPLRLKGGKDV